MNTENSLQIPLVNNEDQIIGFETKKNIHQKGLLHRAFSVFIYRHDNGRTEILLQKRAREKYHSGNLWTNTCCSHPYWKKLSLEENAKRRLKEEFGFFTPLQQIGCFKYRAVLANNLIEHELDHVFIGDYAERKGILNPNPQEIDDYLWCTMDEILKGIYHSPEKFTPWFEKAFRIVNSNYFQKTDEPILFY